MGLTLFTLAMAKRSFMVGVANEPFKDVFTKIAIIPLE